jgi:hypothetical protein
METMEAKLQKTIDSAINKTSSLTFDDFPCICYDTTSYKPGANASRFLIYLGCKKRKLTKGIVEKYGFPASWIGKTPAYTVPWNDGRKVKKINKNHMVENLVFMHSDQPIDCLDARELPIENPAI